MNRPEIARLLRQARSRISPDDVGMPSGERRRVPGLRREEVAALAGVSVDYVVRLEQARGPHPSPGVLSALARALRLNDDARAELFELADVRLPRTDTIDLHVRPSIQRLLDRLNDLPVIVMSAKGDFLAWNSMASALLGDWTRLPVRERNIVWQRFLGEQGRVANTPEEAAQSAAQSVGSLRAAAAKYPHDAELRDLIDRLREASADFRRLWTETDVAPWRSHTKTIRHPEVGDLTLECDSMVLPDTDQSVIVYSAEPGSEAAEKLDLLRVIGMQFSGQSRG
ncbi:MULTISPECIES: helix-turn-helix transcriptional regulator [unclassified Nocardioides]|uniref:helix-turn-helix transcriptional regulator n=1 Tax=unclassified Nocardioides TaxID=2615069 RepID=UPI0006F59BC9|nr:MULTISPECIES: helix-turn-helix transcriptional regulator [unclassified Nocardioides]KQY64211.1 XRE family transcriptional regulator [Nocardioides sp. Root140]KQZ70131.1 XRE family transcriptional regulator [Nocardioides sp. Root151]